MKRQIISRAFYGWLAYCRHLRTVRTHLSGLVSPIIVSPDEPCDARPGVTPERWAQLSCREELFRLAYFGGVCHDIRKQVCSKTGLFSCSGRVVIFKSTKFPVAFPKLKINVSNDNQWVCFEN